MSGLSPNATRICPGCGAEAPITPRGALHPHRAWISSSGLPCPFGGWLVADVEKYANENATPPPPPNRAVRSAEKVEPS